MTTAMIIGASRGIGLGLARELAGRGWQVIASERTKSADLQDLAGEQAERVEIVQADVTDRELGRVHADGQAAGSRIDIVAPERPLTPDIEPAIGIERERMGGNHRSPAQHRQDVFGNTRSMQAHTPMLSPRTTITAN